MKYIYFLIILLGIVSSSELLKVQVSAMSNINNKKAKTMKDFPACEMQRESLIHQEGCLIEGVFKEEDRKKLCEDYSKDLEKSLDCKDNCKAFYKKLNKSNIKFAKEQEKYFKDKKDKIREDRSKQYAKDQKDQEEGFVNGHCFADMSEMGDDFGKPLEPEKDKEKK